MTGCGGADFLSALPYPLNRRIEFIKVAKFVHTES